MFIRQYEKNVIIKMNKMTTANNNAESIKKKEYNLSFISLAVSLLAHLLVFMLGFLAMDLFQQNSGQGGGYVSVSVVKGNPMSRPQGEELQSNAPEPEQFTPKPSGPEEEKPVNTSVPEKKPEKQPDTKKGMKGLGPSDATGYADIGTAGFDSTNLNQMYSEATLNVKVRYPVGWVYVDQQQKKKLDGITFWSSDGRYNPPPYIHVEVVEKYMFNPSQYKFKYEFPNFTGYYNDPEELEGQVSQSIYIRTDDDEDYIIKLIMNGREQFREFQPTFFAMVKSFKFGSSFF